MLVVVFQMISCALTIVHFWAHFYHFCYKLVIHTSSLLLHRSVLYRNITLVKVTVHPKVRNICFSSRMQCSSFILIILLQDFFLFSVVHWN